MDAHCPPEVKRAKRIDHMINERAGTRDIADSDLGDGDDDADVSSDDSVQVTKPTVPIHTAVARRAPTPPLRRNSRLNAPELVKGLPWGKDFEVDVFKKPDFTALEVLSFATGGTSLSAQTQYMI